MGEVVLAVAVVVGLLGIMWLQFMLPFSAAFWLGAGVSVAGAVIGIPASLIYHWLLARVLGSQGDLPKGWYWDPMRYHALLRGQQRTTILAFFGLGAFGFLLVVLGAVFLTLSSLRTL